MKTKETITVVTQLPGARYCPNGNKWENCKALIDVGEAGMRPISCQCKYKQQAYQSKE